MLAFADSRPARSVTPANGTVTFAGVPESSYEIRASAERHAGDTQYVVLNGGETALVSMFLSYVAVSYTVSLRHSAVAVAEPRLGPLAVDGGAHAAGGHL